MRKTILSLIISTIWFLSSASPLRAYYSSMPASTVLGQTDFISETGGLAADKFSTSGGTGIRGIFVDPNGRLIVSDGGNNRVLIWNSIPTSNGTPADLVLGQANFTSGSANRGGSAAANTLSNPVGLWSDGNTLMVGDNTNNRVLIWTSFPTTNGEDADLVIGQSSMSGATYTCDASHTGGAYGIAVLNGKLIISDATGHRVLIFNTIPNTNGVSADMVLGQTDMTTCTSGSISASTFNSPRGLSADSKGKLIVADRSRHRVLVWNSFPTSNGQAADVVIGQLTFATSSNSMTQSTLDWPATVHSTGERLYIGDTQNARVLIYNTIPTTNGAPADLVIGAPNFTSSAASAVCRVTSSCFDSTSSPIGLYVFGNKLFVGDGQASRVLIFENILSTPQVALSSVTSTNGEKIKLQGNVLLGERGTYALQRVQVAINGEGYQEVSKDGGRNDGPSSTRYEFSHEFEPWAGNGPRESWKTRGYTVKVKASSFNDEDDTLFYFSPFTLTKVSADNTAYTLQVPFTHWQRLKDNLHSFQIQLKKDNGPWMSYTNNIPIKDVTVTNDGFVTLTPTYTQIVPQGNYQARIIALDQWGHRQESNTVSFAITTPLVGRSITESDSWFPIQLTALEGAKTTLSNFAFSKQKRYYTTKRPQLTGIAFSGATIRLTVYNTTSQTTVVYETIAKDSLWSITPTLSGSSIVFLSASLGNQVSSLAPFEVYSQ